MIEISDCVTAETIIKSPDFAPLSMQGEYVKIAAKTGLDMAATIRMMAFLPPFMRGDGHLRVRRAMAGRVSRSGPAQQAAVRTHVPALIDAAFRPGTEIDLVAKLTLPLWRKLSFAILGGAEIWPGGDAVALSDDLPLLFASTTSLAERKEMDDRVAAFIAADPDNADERLMILCLSVLGSRPFVGGFGLTLYDVIKESGPRHASEIAWPDLFTRTSLTFIDRIALGDLSVGTNQFRKGDRIRNYTCPAGYSTAEKQRLLFGFGIHGCIGKSITLYAWEKLIRQLSALDVVLEAGEMVMARSCEPFTLPARAMVSVRAA